MNATEIAAWWGAIVASLVFVWDIYKWRKSRSDVRISVSPDMQLLNPLTHRLDEEVNVFVEVVNNGDKVTTLTHLAVTHYKNSFARLRHNPSTQGLIPMPGGSSGFPFELQPGKRWTGLIDQTDLIAKSGSSGLFYCSIYHSASKKPVQTRVRFKK